MAVLKTSWLGCATTLSLALALILGPLGCTADSARADGPRIARLDPDPVAPGAGIRIEGDGFGERGFVSIGGRALDVVAWGERLILATVRGDQPAGPSVLVVTTAGQPSASTPIRVAGPVRRQDDPPRRFPPARDGGPSLDEGVRDMGPSDDGGARDIGPDFDPPDLGDRVLRAEFVSDPIADGAVFMTADTNVPGELILVVRVPAAWGVAFHLAYDRNLLRLRSATPAEQPTAHTAEIAPGRVAAGQALPGGGGEQFFELRFVLVGRGEGRITFPARYRTRRDARNRPIPTAWTDGSLRIREVAE